MYSKLRKVQMRILNTLDRLAMSALSLPTGSDLALHSFVCGVVCMSTFYSSSSRLAIHYHSGFGKGGDTSTQECSLV
jgi:hypothetical protein